MPSPLPTTRLPRRLGAVVYDALLVGALLLVASALSIALNGGEALAPGNALLRGWLALVAIAFYVGFWSVGGQTLGMRAWRLRLVTRDGGPVPLHLSLLRVGFGLLSLLPAGLGFWWSLIDRDGLAWHDRGSGTMLVVLPKSTC